MKKISCLVVLSVLFLIVSCAGTGPIQSYVRGDVDLGYVERVAVLPFENNSKDPYVAERVRDIVSTQILAAGLFDVIDKGLVDSALREEAVDMKKAPMDEALLQRLGQRLGVQAFFFGTVDHYDLVQREGGAYPELALTFRLVDVTSGMVIWQASATEPLWFWPISATTSTGCSGPTGRPGKSSIAGDERIVQAKDSVAVSGRSYVRLRPPIMPQSAVGIKSSCASTSGPKRAPAERFRGPVWL